jgi:hypothetical protein
MKHTVAALLIATGACVAAGQALAQQGTPAAPAAQAPAAGQEAGQSFGISGDDVEGV